MSASTETDVGRSLRQAMGSIQRWGARNRVSEGPTPNEVWLLERLAAQGRGVRMTDLAVWNKVDRSTMTAQVKRLEEKGWARRARDTSDGRAVTAQVTDAGKEALTSYFDAEAEVLTRVLAQWSPQDLAALSALLTRFALTLDED